MPREHKDEPGVDMNATGAGEPLSGAPGTPGREAREREAALERGRAHSGAQDAALCAPQLPGLSADLLYTLVSENVRDYAIFLLDAGGIIRCWGESARLMKWWTKEEAEGSHLRMLYPDGGSEDGTAEAHLIEAAAKGEYTGEGHRVRRDQTLFWAYVTLSALRNAEGKLVGFTKVTRDFSARRAVESALQRERALAAVREAGEDSARIKRQVANLSHELRSPLQAILGSIALLERQLPVAADRAHIERIQRNSRHLLALLDDVLELSRTDSGEMPLSPEVHRLGPVITEALADIEAQPIAHGRTILNAVSGGAGDVPFWGDARRVRQILVNLLTNAIKFTPSGGRITISGGTGERVTGASLSGAGPWMYARVEDTGRGIPPEHLEGIFEPFQQSQVTDQQRGTGLGLSISRQFARAMGGDLTAESELGAGSRFTLWLPIAPTEPIPR